MKAMTRKKTPQTKAFRIKPLVVLGSGVSLPTFKDAGSVTHLTECLFHEPWACNSSGEWHPRSAFVTEDTPPCQEFLRRLRRYVEDYYSKQRGFAANYEDWFFLIEQMGEEMGWGGNAAVQPFRQAMNTICADLKGPCKIVTGDPFRSLIADTLVFIQSVIAHELSTRNEPVGLTLLKGLAGLPGAEPLTVCSLNHDLLVERFFKTENIKFTDGFPEEHENGVRYFNRAEFARPRVKARLLKLHGSINWWAFSQSNGDFSDTRIGIRALPLEDCRTRSGKRLWNTDPVPHFLTGSENKLAAYQSGIFLAQMREFDRALDEHELIVMSGYGWGDSGVNRRLKSWLAENEDRQLIVLHENTKQLRQYKPLLHSFARLRESKKLILIRKWLCDVDGEHFCRRLEKRAGLVSERAFVFRRRTSSKKNSPR